jgi:hypothetical protein
VQRAGTARASSSRPSMWVMPASSSPSRRSRISRIQRSPGRSVVLFAAHQTARRGRPRACRGAIRRPGRLDPRSGRRSSSPRTVAGRACDARFVVVQTTRARRGPHRGRRPAPDQ